MQIIARNQPQEPDIKPVFVKWIRGSNSIKTKTRSIDSQLRKVNYEKSAGCFYINGGFISYGGGVWKPDRNALILFCAGEPVGICEFDLTSYINKFNNHDEKVMLRPTDYVPKPENSNEKYLRCLGNIAEFECAHIVFRITIKSKNEPCRTPRPKSARNLSARVTPRLAGKANSGKGHFSFGSTKAATHLSTPSLKIMDRWETESIIEHSDEGLSDSFIDINVSDQLRQTTTTYPVVHF